MDIAKSLKATAERIAELKGAKYLIHYPPEGEPMTAAYLEAHSPEFCAAMVELGTLEERARMLRALSLRSEEGTISDDPEALSEAQPSAPPQDAGTWRE